MGAVLKIVLKILHFLEDFFCIKTQCKGIIMETMLTLSVGGFPPLSARGCEQTLSVINDGDMRRTINGTLVLNKNQPIKKYKSIIKCKDKTSLASFGLYPGKDIMVGCIHHLFQAGNVGDNGLERPFVDGSIQVININRELIPFIIQNKTIHIEQTNNMDPIFISYRPLLSMRVVRYELFTYEWSLESGWELELEEI
jgi:hypothetical protein